MKRVVIAVTMLSFGMVVGKAVPAQAADFAASKGRWFPAGDRPRVKRGPHEEVQRVFEAEEPAPQEGLSSLNLRLRDVRAAGEAVNEALETSFKVLDLLTALVLKFPQYAERLAERFKGKSVELDKIVLLGELARLKDKVLIPALARYKLKEMFAKESGKKLSPELLDAIIEQLAPTETTKAEWEGYLKKVRAFVNTAYATKGVGAALSSKELLDRVNKIDEWVGQFFNILAAVQAGDIEKDQASSIKKGVAELEKLLDPMDALHKLISTDRQKALGRTFARNPRMALEVVEALIKPVHQSTGEVRDALLLYPEQKIEKDEV